MSRFRLLLLLLLCLPVATAQAQTGEPTAEPGTESPPIPQIHTVESGENLTLIAQNYGVTVEELLVLNNLSEDDLLYVGQPLIIPGGEGEAMATVYTVQAGDTLENIAAMFQTNRNHLAATNNLINPYHNLIIGQSLSVVSRTGSALPQPVTGTPHVVTKGETLLMIAAQYNLSPMALAAANGLSFPTYLYAGQRLRIPGEEIYYYLPGEWVDVRVRPLPIIQGATVSIYVKNLLNGRAMGTFAGQTLHFTPYEDGFVALVGLDAFTEPGVYSLELEGSGERPWQPFRQDVRVESGNYDTQYITIPDELSYLLAPEVRQNEDAFLETIYTQFTETRYWEGIFQMPITNTVVTAGYGDARSYNGGPIEIFHTGIDFSGTIGTPILAPANGIVIFNDALQLRGNAVIIDHGLGVMTAYFHLSESYVNVGESVIMGQPVGAGGSTGLSSGPHLHWDLRIMNVPVNGRQWVDNIFP